MAQKEVRNNVTSNTTNKEEKNMKKDYTLGGSLTATTWQEFRVAMKEVGIDTGTKTYAQLVEEYNALPKEEIVPVGDMSSDKYPEEQEEEKGFDFNIKTVDTEHLQKICHNIWLRSYECTKSLSEENIGKRMIKKNSLYGAIYDAYKKEIGKTEVPDKFYQRISWSLEHCEYITIKKYDNNAFAIFVEDKCKESVKVVTSTVGKIDITFF